MDKAGRLPLLLLACAICWVGAERASEMEGECRWFCTEDLQRGTLWETHCGGAMDHLCGGCAHCGEAPPSSAMSEIAASKHEGFPEVIHDWLRKHLPSTTDAPRTAGGHTPAASPTPSGSPTSAGTAGSTCESQLSNMACKGQFGHQDCHTCKDRIAALTAHGTSEAKAKEQVGTEYVDKCGGCAPQQGGLSTEGYKEVFRDDFDGDKLDRNKWDMVNKGGGFGNHELQFYSNRDANAIVKDGILTILAKRENFGGMHFTSAKLKSKPAWTYGKVSFRAKMSGANVRGTWPALWMMPRANNYGGWPNSGEIDIMENVGYEGNKIHGTVHTGAYNHMKGTQRGSAMTTDIGEWHVYAIEWKDDGIVWAVDGKKYHTFARESSTDKAKWPFDRDFYIIMNLAVGGDWGGAKGVDNGAFNSGQKVEVDWVSVEQKK